MWGGDGWYTQLAHTFNFRNISLFLLCKCLTSLFNRRSGHPWSCQPVTERTFASYHALQFLMDSASLTPRIALGSEKRRCQVQHRHCK